MNKEKDMTKVLKVKCPKCAKEFNYYSSEFRPFCCEKCKMIDLGTWFDGSYNINGKSNTVYIENPENFGSDESDFFKDDDE